MIGMDWEGEGSLGATPEEIVESLREDLRYAEKQTDRLLKARSFGHENCLKDFYFGSEDRGDNRCELCRVKDEIRAERGIR